MKIFCLVALFQFNVAILHGHNEGWTVLPNHPDTKRIYTDTIIHKGFVFATTEIGTVYAWNLLEPGNYLSLYTTSLLVHSLYSASY